MGILFQKDTNSFLKFAKSDYDILTNTYGEQNWNLVDPTKKEPIK